MPSTPLVLAPPARTRTRSGRSYTAELRARGLNAGGGPRTDADVAWIARNPVPMLLLEGKGLVRIGKGLRDFVKLVKQGADDLDASGEEQPGQEQPADPEQ
jgi:hypothetical protein